MIKIFFRISLLVIIFVLNSCLVHTYYGIFEIKNVEQNKSKNIMESGNGYIIKADNGQIVELSNSFWPPTLTLEIKFKAIEKYKIINDRVLMYNKSDTTELKPLKNIKGVIIPKDSIFTCMFIHRWFMDIDTLKLKFTSNKYNFKLFDIYSIKDEKVLNIPELETEFKMIFPEKW